MKVLQVLWIAIGFAVCVLAMGCQSSSGGGVAVAPVCGDGVCAGSESAFACPSDCTQAPTGPYCGNGKCESGESSSNCVYDCPKQCSPSCDGRQCGSDGCGGSCGSCPASAPSCSSAGVCIQPSPVCGDGKCESGETASSCATDCSPASTEHYCDSHCGDKDSAPSGCYCDDQCGQYGDCCLANGGKAGASDNFACMGSTCQACKIAPCKPNCPSNTCGSDGCGGKCTCATGSTCSGTTCVGKPVCVDECIADSCVGGMLVTCQKGPDGCYKKLSPSACSNGKVCKAGGNACATCTAQSDCPADQICSLTQGCRSPFGMSYKVTIHSADFPAQNGATSWDAGGGLPDPQICISNDVKNLACTSVKNDVLTANFEETFAIDLLPGDKLCFQALDSDLAVSDDADGVCWPAFAEIVKAGGYSGKMYNNVVWLNFTIKPAY